MGLNGANWIWTSSNTSAQTRNPISGSFKVRAGGGMWLKSPLTSLPLSRPEPPSPPHPKTPLLHPYPLASSLPSGVFTLVGECSYITGSVLPALLMALAYTWLHLLTGYLQLPVCPSCPQQQGKD